MAYTAEANASTFTSKKMLKTTTDYLRAHPYHIPAAGVAITAGALAAPWILGAAGFSAAGPVAGSIAAGWQSSLGVVQAGSLFAWCQSAVMGGYAAQTITAASVAGMGIAGAGTGANLLVKQLGKNKVDLQRAFEEGFRRGPHSKSVKK